MSTPCSAAMKPSTEKTTKPAKKLVPLLMRASTNASLQRNTERKKETEREKHNTENDIWRKFRFIIYCNMTLTKDTQDKYWQQKSWAGMVNRGSIAISLKAAVVL